MELGSADLGAGLAASLTMVTTTLTVLTGPFVDLVDQRNIFSYLGAAGFLALVVIVVKARSPDRRRRLVALLRLIGRRSAWRHRSAILDYKMFGFNLLFALFISGYLVVGTNVWAGVGAYLLEQLAGPAPTGTAPDPAKSLVVTLVMLLAFDFGYWLSHWAAHKNRYLWEFHKVHHSAEVLNIATEYRQHPVENILHPTVIGMVSGAAYAVLNQFFGYGIMVSGLAGFNIIVILHLMTFHHLRHSHINMPFTGVFGKLLHSPAHHMIHHSDNPAHFDRNMGYMLSIWDWMAGTLYVPRPGERIVLGIGPEGRAHDTLRGALFLPFRAAARLVTDRSRLPIANDVAR